MWASPEGITHLIRVPWEYADYAVAQLRALIPGIRVTPEQEYPKRVWVSAVELGLRNSHRTLRIASPRALSSSLLASTQGLRDNETMVLQWVVTPAAVKELPVRGRSPSQQTSPMGLLLHSAGASTDEIDERRRKLGEANLLAVLRVGTVAATEERALHLQYNIRGTLSRRHVVPPLDSSSGGG